MTKEGKKDTFDWEQLDKYLQFKITLKMAGELMGCHPNTIMNHIRDKFDMTFAQYSDLKMSNVKVKLVQKALEMARNGNTTMMIFCLKNVCGWSDKNNVEVESKGNLIINSFKKPPESKEES